MPPPLPDDPALPGACDLLAGAGEACLARFLAGRGFDLVSLEPVQAIYRPGRSLAVRFNTGTRQRASGSPASFILTVEARAEEDAARPKGAPPPPSPRVGLLPEPFDTSGPFTVWAFPYDPSLPGLPVAAHPKTVRRRLSPRPGPVAVEPVRYRPRQRAVLRYRLADDPRGLLFAKVLPPARGASALATADALRGAVARPSSGPVSGSAGSGSPGRLRLALPAARTGPGVLLVPQIGGRCLRDLLVEGGRLPPPERIAGLPAALTGLAGDVLPLAPAAGRAARGRAPLAAAEAAARTITRLAPAVVGPATRVVDAVATGADGGETGRSIVHGDLYEGQVFVAADGVSLGLVDLDDLGPGDPALDVANFCAHLLLLATSYGRAAARIFDYREQVRAAAIDRFGLRPAALVLWEAYAMLLLATNPFRVLHPDWPARVAARVETAEQLLVGAPVGGDHR